MVKRKRKYFTKKEINQLLEGLGFEDSKVKSSMKTKEFEDFLEGLGLEKEEIKEIIKGMN